MPCIFWVSFQNFPSLFFQLEFSFFPPKPPKTRSRSLSPKLSQILPNPNPKKSNLSPKKLPQAQENGPVDRGSPRSWRHGRRRRPPVTASDGEEAAAIHQRNGSPQLQIIRRKAKNRPLSQGILNFPNFLDPEFETLDCWVLMEKVRFLILLVELFCCRGAEREREEQCHWCNALRFRKASKTGKMETPFLRVFTIFGIQNYLWL